jgi:transposase InsO family protein
MRFCRTNRLEPSMSRRGICWDNAVAESFFASLKKERIKQRIYKNRNLAVAGVSDYIGSFYNRIRRHRQVVSQRCAKPQRSAHSGLSSETRELRDFG